MSPRVRRSLTASCRGFITIDEEYDYCEICGWLHAIDEAHRAVQELLVSRGITEQAARFSRAEERLCVSVRYSRLCR